MLILGLKLDTPDDRVRLRCPDGSEIWVHLIQARKDYVRLAFDAPIAVDIARYSLIPAAEKPARPAAG